MTRVEKEHPPRTWPAWAATRHEFARLVAAAEEVAARDAEEREIEITVEGYDRPFKSPDEFLENVDEDEWLSLRGIGAALHLGVYPNVMRVYIDVGGLFDEARLTLRGRSRRERNAIEPDLATLIDQHAQSVPRTWVPSIGIIALCTVLYVAAAVLLAFLVTKVSDLSVLVLLPPSLLLLSIAFVPLTAKADRALGEIYRPVEFLPDDERSRRVRVFASTGGKLRAVAAAVLFVAAVVGAIAAVVDAAK